MFLTRRFAAFAAVTVLAVPAASASAATSPATASDQGSPHCPDGYSGPTNLATGCPWYLMVP
jgi:hypothetical protein